MRREMPRTAVPLVTARMPRWLILPVRIIIFTGFLVAALFMFTTPALTLIHILLIFTQVIFSLAVLAECGRSAEYYRKLDEAETLARKREDEDTL